MTKIIMLRKKRRMNIVKGKDFTDDQICYRPKTIYTKLATWKISSNYPNHLEASMKPPKLKLEGKLPSCACV